MPLEWAGSKPEFDAKAILVYARAKSGKSRLLASAPEPVLVLDFDDNFPIAALPAGTKVARIVPRNYEETLLIMQKLSASSTGFGVVYEGQSFNTLGFDTLTNLYPLILDDVLHLPVDRKIASLLEGSHGDATRQKREIPAIQDYGLTGERLKNLIRKCRQLPCHFVAIAHEELYTFKPPGGSEGKVQADLAVKAGISLTEKLNERIPGLFNLYLRIKVSNPASESPRPEHYQIGTVQSDYFYPAGDATGLLAPQESPDLAAIIKKAGGFIPGEVNTLPDGSLTQKVSDR